MRLPSHVDSLGVRSAPFDDSVARARAAAVFCLLALAGCSRDAPPALLGTIERDRLELTAETSDPLTELRVREGQPVAAGDVLARQDPAALGAELNAAEARADEARARLLEAERGPRREDIDQARARLRSQQASLLAATREYERVQQLVADRLVSRSELDRRLQEKDRAAAGVDEATEALRELTRGTRAEQVEQARSAAGAAAADVARLRTRVGRLTLSAPRSATVEALPYRVGERPPAGTPVVILLADDAPFARVYVPEPLRAGLAPGAPAEVHVDGVERAYRAKLRYVASQAAFTPYYALNQRDRSRLAYLAEFTLDEPEARTLPSGVPVRVVLTAGPSP